MRGALILAVALLAACTGEGRGSGSQPRSPLSHALIRAEEVPGDLEGAEDRTVTDIRQVLPRRRDFPNVPPLPGAVRTGLETGAENRFAVTAGPTPPPPRPGQVTFASSWAVRFDDLAAATACFTYLRGIEVGSAALVPRQELPAQGVGDQAYAWHRLPTIASEEIAGTESFGLAWRRGDVVAAVAVGGGPGAVDEADARALAETVDGRLAGLSG